MSKFYNLSEETIDSFKAIYDKKTFATNIGFQYVGSTAQKTLIKITKIPDQYSFLLEKELLVSINEDLILVYDEESVEILIEQEIDKISENMETGKIKLLKPDINTFSGLINKYGIDKVAKANKVEELYSEQQRDAEEDFII
jgi:hypothetical protein